MISAEAFLRRNPVASQDMPIAEQHVQSKPSGRFSRRGRDAAVVEDPNDLDACREAALRLLDAAPRASGALRERLLAKGYGEAIVDEVIERLIRVQLIDDSAYAESAVRYCAGRMMGRRGTVMELARKGVDRKLAEQVCDEAEQNGIFEDAASEDTALEDAAFSEVVLVEEAALSEAAVLSAGVSEVVSCSSGTFTSVSVEASASAGASCPGSVRLFSSSES